MKSRLVYFVFAVVMFGCGGAEFTADDVAQNDRGVAEMGRFEYAQAERTFAALVERTPDWLDARVNHAIATLNRQEDGDEHLALEMLETVLVDSPNHLRALYTSGIIHLYLGDAEAAAAQFRAAADGDPNDAYSAYYLGQSLLQTQAFDEAARWLLRARDLDPYLRSSYWAGAQALRRQGRDDEAAALLEDYQRFEKNPAARLAGFSYKKMGPKAEARSAYVDESPIPERPRGSLFREATALIRGNFVDPSITVVDLDGDDVLEFAIAHQAGVEIFRRDGRSVPVPFSGMHDAALLWGDVDDDGQVDVVTCSSIGTTLWLFEDGWRRVDLDSTPCRDGTIFDADHDGDLDVLAVRANGIELFSNNEDGTFRRLGGLLGLENIVGRQVYATDLDADRDLDILVLGAQGNRVLMNDRTWTYVASDAVEGFAGAPLLGVISADLDADGWVEVYGLQEEGGVIAWRRNEDLSWSMGTIVPAEATGRTDALAAVDFDGDGVLELIGYGPSGMVGWTAEGQEAYRLDAANRGMMSAVNEPGRGPSVLLVDPGGLSERAPGAGRFAFLAIRPTGRSEAEQMRSNASGIGTRMMLRYDGRWTVREAIDMQSTRGQSLGSYAFGLGGASKADYVRLEWSDGVSQTETNLAAGQLHAIAEVQRQLASCPVVFAWDGTGFSFVSDVLGVAGLGFLAAPNEYAKPRSFERFLLAADQLAPRDGRYQIKLTEPMEETAYLDAVTLDVYELPPGWSMVLDERMATGAPAVTGRPITFRSQYLPVSAVSRDGSDVFDAITAADGVAPEPGRIDARFIGLLEEHQTVTIEFDAALTGDDLVLVAEGWVEYPYSQTVFSAWQAGLRYESASIDARDSNGRWHRLFQEFGYPAGMPRSMALPLGGLPSGTTALRVSSNLEIYWDRLRVVREEPLPLDDLESFVTTLKPLGARVQRTGFPERKNLAQRRPSYDYAQRSTYWDAKMHRGYYTALGDALELVATQDSALAIFGSGEEIHIEFEALPARDRQRFFAIDFRGFAKDMDLYTQHGDTVTPLPTPDGVGLREAGLRQALHDRYNVRFQDGL